MAKAKQVQSESSEVDPTEDRAKITARLALRPSVKGALTIQDYSKGFGEMDFPTLLEELATQVNAVNDGDLKRAEGMLMVQAHTLDSIFNTLASRAIKAEYMTQLEPFLRLALKAQSQCRATLETLAAIKNPQPVAFVKQANIAHGPQQVNNGVPPATAPAPPPPQTVADVAGAATEPLYLGHPARGETENVPNELLSQPVHATR